MYASQSAEMPFFIYAYGADWKTGEKSIAKMSTPENHEYLSDFSTDRHETTTKRKKTKNYIDIGPQMLVSSEETLFFRSVLVSDNREKRPFERTLSNFSTLKNQSIAPSNQISLLFCKMQEKTSI